MGRLGAIALGAVVAVALVLTSCDPAQDQPQPFDANEVAQIAQAPPATSFGVDRSAALLGGVGLPTPSSWDVGLGPLLVAVQLQGINSAWPVTSGAVSAAIQAMCSPYSDASRALDSFLYNATPGAQLSALAPLEGMLDDAALESALCRARVPALRSLLFSRLTANTLNVRAPVASRYVPPTFRIAAVPSAFGQRVCSTLEQGKDLISRGAGWLFEHFTGEEGAREVVEFATSAVIELCPQYINPVLTTMDQLVSAVLDGGGQ